VQIALLPAYDPDMERRGDAYAAEVGAVLERFVARYGGGHEPIPVEDIADSLYGLRIVEVDGMQCSGMLVPARRLVYLNAEECRSVPRRRRFTIAHELGHLVLHARARAATVYCRQVQPSDATTSDAIEREANHVAAELLMPETLVRAAVAAGDVSSVQIADRFEVSEPAAAWRLFNLGLRDDPPAASA
jgi:Zn-dependent peptidase ImmA (M78 family)